MIDKRRIHKGNTLAKEEPIAVGAAIDDRLGHDLNMRFQLIGIQFRNAKNSTHKRSDSLRYHVTDFATVGERKRAMPTTPE